MTTLLVLFLSISFAVTQQPVQDTGTQVPSTITEATVYLRGAQVTRNAEVELQAGNNTITFSDLSIQFSEPSIQIATDKQITILSLRKNRSGDVTGSQKLDSLEAVRAELQSQLEYKQAEQQVLNYELNILQANQTLRGQNEKISAAEIKQAMDYFREKLTEIERSKIEVKNSIAETEKKLKEINDAINSIKQNEQKQSGEIVAEIQSPRTQIVNFSLSYFIPNAGWTPSYDVRVSDIDQPVSLSYKANIYQQTGIDWNNVTLSVSSAQPLASTTIPSFQPVFLGFVQPRPQARFEAEQELSVSQKSREDAQITLRGASSIPSVSVNQNQTSFSFTIETPYSVPGNGDRKTATLMDHSLPASYSYYVQPKAREKAYLQAMVTDWEDLNLLNGQANLYFGQSFVGQSQIQANAVSDTLKFSMGQDESISIERNRLKEFSEKNFFGNRVRETRAWELTVRNNKNRPIKLTLVDQIPVSTNEDIEVDLQERNGASLNKETGELTWNLTISAGESVSRQFRYQVEYPSGKRIQEQ